MGHDSSVVRDNAGLEIERRLHEELRYVGSSDDGWSQLFVDRFDYTYWEMTFPQSDMHGGGPKLLSQVTKDFAHAKYSIQSG